MENLGLLINIPKICDTFSVAMQISEANSRPSLARK